jgi:hypothetical protein
MRLTFAPIAFTSTCATEILNRDFIKMPELSRLFGITIYMFYEDHAPPHFHARYGEFEALIRAILDGKLPVRALGLVVEWASLHQEELLENWKRAQSGEPIAKISPLQ